MSYSSERNLEKRTFAHPKCCVIVNGAIYSDIRNVIRYNDISKGHSNKNRLSVLKSDAENPRLESNVVKDRQTEIKIMIEIIEDAEIQLYMKSVYKENKNNGKEFLEKMLECLSSANYAFIN